MRQADTACTTRRAVMAAAATAPLWASSSFRDRAGTGDHVANAVRERCWALLSSSPEGLRVFRQADRIAPSWAALRSVAAQGPGGPELVFGVPDVSADEISVSLAGAFRYGPIPAVAADLRQGGEALWWRSL